MSASWHRRFCVSSFWFGLGGTILGGIGLVTFNLAIFRLYYALVLLALIAAVAGLRDKSGPSENRLWAWWGIGLPAFFLFLVVGFAAPLCGIVKQAEVGNRIRVSLTTLTAALHKHDEVHGYLPAAASLDKDGKPLLSWRVAILPFLGENALYREFKQDEPWDGAHNLTRNRSQSPA